MLLKVRLMQVVFVISELQNRTCLGMRAIFQHCKCFKYLNRRGRKYKDFQYLVHTKKAQFSSATQFYPNAGLT